MAITTKQFQLLTDINIVWDFLVDIYDRENGSGMNTMLLLLMRAVNMCALRECGGSRKIN